jgi:opacity protein-like surface antigen
MKSLRTLALLPLAAAAAQAYTIELQLGENRPTGYKNGTVIGLNIAGQVGQNVSLGLNLSDQNIEDTASTYNVKARNASFDIVYELNPRGAIHPYIGAGIGYAWLSDTEAFTKSKSVMTSSALAGIRFELSRDVDIAFNVRNTQLHSVSNLAGTSKNAIKLWESTVGLRFKF